MLTPFQKNNFIGCDIIVINLVHLISTWLSVWSSAIKVILYGFLFYCLWIKYSKGWMSKNVHFCQLYFLYLKLWATYLENGCAFTHMGCIIKGSDNTFQDMLLKTKSIRKPRYEKLKLLLTHPLYLYICIKEYKEWGGGNFL